MKLFRSLSGLLCAVLMFTLLMPAASAAEFSDIPDNKWYSKAVNWASEEGIVSGYPDGTFRPGGSLTRGEFAVMIDKLLGLEEEAENTFEDVNEGRFYTKPILRCVKAGILSGYNETRFGVSDRITRQQAAVVLSRAFGLSETKGRTDFKDDAEIGSYAVGCVHTMSLKGYITGGTDGRFNPKDAITRAQAVGILYKMSRKETPVDPSKEDTQVSDGFKKLAAGKDLRILYLGDSISEGFGLSDPGTQAFPALLSEALEEKYEIDVEYENLSVSGSNAYGSWTILHQMDDSEDYDLVVICDGHNDVTGRFSLQYEALLRAVNDKYPEASVIAVKENTLERFGYTAKEEILETLCSRYGVPLCDMIDFYAESGKSYDSVTQSDGLHPNAEGQQLYCEALLDLIGKLTEEGYAAMKRPSSLNSDVIKYDYFSYLSTDRFTREDDTTYVIYLDKAVKGGLGSENTGRKADWCERVYADDELAADLSFQDREYWSGHRFYNLTGDVSASKTLRVVFRDKEQADGFRGLIFNSDSPF